MLHSPRLARKMPVMQAIHKIDKMQIQTAVLGDAQQSCDHVSSK